MDNIPDGYCRCGCGEKTPISPKTDRGHGYVKGQPRLYVPYHHKRKTSPEYLIESRRHSTPCWIWQRCTARGYGQKRVGGKMVYVHRLYYERKYGPIPEGAELDHLCRVPPCVNPDHLESVTHTENMRRASNTKFDLERAREMRRLYATGEYTQMRLAGLFQIHQTVVSDVVNGVYWRE